jgi:membrane-associated phospholipid phosphatase
LAAAISGATRGGIGWHLVSAGLVLTGRPTPRRTAAATSMAWVSTTLVVAGLKRMTKRRRPHLTAAAGPSTRTSSMPSSHTATAFAYSSAAAIQHPGAAPLLLASAATAWARLRTRRHFPTDVAVGAAIGLAIGATIGVLIRRAAGRTPVTTPGDPGPAVVEGAVRP